MMGYSDYLKNTLKPLGIYDLDVGLGSAELEALGGLMDEAEQSLSLTLREMLPMTAQSAGLTKYESLFPGVSPVSALADRRKVVCILMRLGECECSDQGLNYVFTLCGIPAAVSETTTKETVKVTFTEDAPTGDELLKVKKRIEAILPCHLDIVYA